jgi:hypothetical protein
MDTQGTEIRDQNPALQRPLAAINPAGRPFSLPNQA